MLLAPLQVNNTPEKALVNAWEGVGLFMDEVEITLESNPTRTKAGREDDGLKGGELDYSSGDIPAGHGSQTISVV